MKFNKHIVVLVSLTSLAASLLQAGQSWENCPRSDLDNNWAWSDWMGWINDANYPWVYHLEHKWLYQVTTDEENIWFYDWDVEDWIWTNRQVYHAQGSKWFYFKGADLWCHFAGGAKPNRWWQLKDGSYLSDADLKAL